MTLSSWGRWWSGCWEECALSGSQLPFKLLLTALLPLSVTTSACMQMQPANQRCARMLIFHGPLLGIDMLFLLMRWIQYIRKPRVQLLSAVCLLSVLVLLDGFNPVNNAIVISQTICCFAFAACMHACMHALSWGTRANVPACLGRSSSVSSRPPVMQGSSSTHSVVVYTGAGLKWGPFRICAGVKLSPCKTIFVIYM